MSKITAESISKCAAELRQAMKEAKHTPVFVERRLDDYESGRVKPETFRPVFVAADAGRRRRN